MTGHVVPFFTRAVVLTESRCSAGVFRKVFGQNLKSEKNSENFSNLAKRFLVVSNSEYGEVSKKSAICMNIVHVLQRYKNVLNLFYHNSSKCFLSSSAHASKSDLLKSEKKEEKVALKKNEISFDDIKTFMKTDGIFLFDVREPKEVAQSGMLPSAINLPLSKLKCSLQMTDEEFKEEFKVEKPLPSTSHMVVFYGLASVKGASAVEIAHKMGYVKSRYYPGGYEEWKSKQTA